MEGLIERCYAKGGEKCDKLIDSQKKVYTRGSVLNDLSNRIY